MPIPTPHINAAEGDFAETILLPGDPLRAKHIAETHLEDARQVTDVRNMLGFTGTYSGHPVSVMGSGMGVPSASIYAHELVAEYGVKKIIRVGSCGGIAPGLAMRDVILVAGACSDSGVNRVRYGGYDFSAIADFGLLRAAANAADEAGIVFRAGLVHTTDLFYSPEQGRFERMQSMGILAVEMEAAGLYGLAAEHGVRALAILTVSDHVFTQEATSSDERQTTFDDMVRMALEAAIRDEG